MNSTTNKSTKRKRIEGVNPILKLKQYFCMHDYSIIAKHRSSSQNLWRCRKCKVFVIQHWGIGLHYKCKVPNIDGWIFKDGLKG